MKLLLAKDSEVTISYTNLHYGKIVLDISKPDALNLLGQIIDEFGILALINCLSVDEATELLEEVKECNN